MRVSTKLALGYGLLIALLGVLLAYHVSTVKANAAEGRKLSALTARLLLAATDQRYWLDQMEESARKYRILGDSGYARKFEEYAGKFGGALSSFERVSMTPEEAETLSRLADTWRSFRASAATRGLRTGAMASPGASTIASGFEPFGAAGESRPALDAWFQDLRRQTDDLMDASRAAMVSRVRAAEGRSQRAEVVAWVGGGAAFVLGGAVWFLVMGRVIGGLESLTLATREVAEGDFTHRMEADGSDEFAQVARAFNGMTERLGELDRLKRDFVSRVSHDLKSPLASMQEANNLLLDGLAGEVTAQQRRFLELSRANGERLRSMISKLLGLSRLEADGDRTQIGPFDLRSLVRSTTERLSPSFHKRRVALSLWLPEDPLPVRCDGGQIEQLLENLLENAQRFAPEGSVVSVTLETLPRGSDDVPARRWDELAPPAEAHEVVRLAVADAGPGIDHADRERVFDRFHYAKGASENGGVGLGLTICRGVAQSHGGTIWVEDAPSGGAEFVVLLPLRSAGVSPEVFRVASA